MNIDLRDGYLFRAAESASWISHHPFVGSTIANRLKLHTKNAGILGNETMHSFRSGCSITLSLLGVNTEDVARHVGWKSASTAEYYSQTGKVMNSERVASLLAGSTSTPQGGMAMATAHTKAYTANDDLSNLSPAFP